ncbi:MAG TPA: hypothetical protein VE553_10100 [Candidatus Binatia bacterium]|nr:hypothetical protein [Candidatus Binatia bacterium]
MSRVINTNSPTKVRNQARRTIAELLRRLSQKSQIDAEARDMAAAIVFMLNDINSSVEQTISAWEKRGYWMKAERFLREWEWAREAAANFDDVIRNEAWDLLPRLLAELFPQFADVQVKKMTRPASDWKGAYKRLINGPAAQAPWQ